MRSPKKYKTLYADKDAYVFTRILDDEEVIVAVNTGDKHSTANFAVTELQSQPSEVVYGSGRLAWHNTADASTLEITLPANTGAIVA